MMIVWCIILIAITMTSWGRFAFVWRHKKLHAAQLKRVSVYLAGGFLWFSLSALLTLIEANPFLLYCILASLFWIQGVLHVWILEDYFRDFAEAFSEWQMWISLYVFGISALGFVVLGFWLNPCQPKTYYHSAWLFSCIPIFCYVSYSAWRNLPALVPDGWVFKDNYSPPEPGRDKIIHYAFKLPDRVKPITVKISEKYRMGDAFHLVILDSRKGIPQFYKDKAGEQKPLNWYFAIHNKQGKKKRYLDPEASFKENKLGNNMIINVSHQP